MAFIWTELVSCWLEEWSCGHILTIYLTTKIETLPIWNPTFYYKNQLKWRNLYLTFLWFFLAVQHERAPRTQLPSSTCPVRRTPYPFGQPSGVTGHASAIADLAGYHLVYPQPTLPFHFGLKPPTMAFPLGLLNYPGHFSPAFFAQVRTRYLYLFEVWVAHGCMGIFW